MALKDLTQNQLFLLFSAAVVASIVLPRVPYGRQALYPFGLLSTWVHEVGHGVSAIMVGGKFERLEIYPELGGAATSSGVRGASRAVVAAGGLLGPSLAGGGIIILGSQDSTAPWILAGLAGSIIVSLVLVVRNRFGWLALAAIAASLIPISLYAPSHLKIFLAQFVGIQFCLASLATLDYMFTKHFYRNGVAIDSDTQEIANVLLLPYWFWGALIALFSFMVLLGSFYLAWFYPYKPWFLT